MLPLFKTNVHTNLVPLFAIEMIFEIIFYLQALKYSVDYFTPQWVGAYRPVFSYFDLSFYLANSSAFVYQSALIAAIVLMNAFWVVQLSMFLLGKEYSNRAANVRKLILIVTKNVLFLPFVNVVLECELHYLA
jgi:hypothetical protein